MFFSHQLCILFHYLLIFSLMYRRRRTTFCCYRQLQRVQSKRSKSIQNGNKWTNRKKKTLGDKRRRKKEDRWGKKNKTNDVKNWKKKYWKWSWKHYTIKCRVTVHHWQFGECYEERGVSWDRKEFKQRLATLLHWYFPVNRKYLPILKNTDD